MSSRSTAAALACTLALAACGTPTTRSDAAPTRREPGAISTRTALEPIPRPPHDLGIRASVAPFDDTIVALGGIRIAAGRVRPIRAVQRYDTTHGWSDLPPIPTRRPLLAPGVVGSPHAVIAVGTPCGATSADEHDATCAEGTVAAFALDVRSRRWRRLPDPPQPANPHRVPASVRGLGWTGSTAAFTLAIGDRATLVVYRPRTSTWQAIDLSHASDSGPCLQGPYVVVAAAAPRTPGSGGVAATGPSNGLITGARVDARAPRLRWRSLPEFRATTRSGSSDARVFDVSCAAGRQFVATAFGHTPDDTQQFWLDEDTEAWPPVEPPSDISGGDFAAISVEGVRVLWPTSATSVFVRRHRGAWAGHDRPFPADGPPFVFVPIGRRLVVAAMGAPGGSTDLVIIDLAPRIDASIRADPLPQS